MTDSEIPTIGVAGVSAFAALAGLTQVGIPAEVAFGITTAFVSAVTAASLGYTPVASAGVGVGIGVIEGGLFALTMLFPTLLGVPISTTVTTIVLFVVVACSIGGATGFSTRILLKKTAA